MKLCIVYYSRCNIWRVSFQKSLNPLFIVLRNSTLFRITIILWHYINSDNFVVNEKCHICKPKTHASFTLSFNSHFYVFLYFHQFVDLGPFRNILNRPIFGKLFPKIFVIFLSILIEGECASNQKLITASKVVLNTLSYVCF